MTDEEIKALEERNAELERQNAELERQNADLIAERDSLKEENDTLKTNSAALSEELLETKKLNFTLARRTSSEQKSAEDILNEMFK